MPFPTRVLLVLLTASLYWHAGESVAHAQTSEFETVSFPGSEPETPQPIGDRVPATGVFFRPPSTIWGMRIMSPSGGSG